MYHWVTMLYSRNWHNTVNQLYRKFKKYKKKKKKKGNSHCGSVVMNPTGIHEDTGSIPGLVWWVRDPALP